ncbi:MAG: tetratricopeptide repeat protein [Acidobacteria bacterium]|nr:tetratricopeptide repeat protein [Acidobacteriota bacterium]
MSKQAIIAPEEKLVRELIVAGEADCSEFVAHHPELHKPEMVTQLADRVREHIRVNVQEALRLADVTLAIAQSLPEEKESLARALRAKANVLSAQGHNAAAVDLQQQAAAWFDAVGNTAEVARTLSGSIQPLLLLGEYSRAFSAAERARMIFAAAGNTWRLARLEINVGNIYYRQDRFAEAIACYERAYDGLQAQNDPEGIAAVLSNMITCRISLNQFPEALEAHRRTREFCEEHGMPLLVTQADYNVAYLYYLRGEYNKAIEMLRATRVNAEKVGDAYHSALCDLDLAELHLELNLSAKAGELAQRGHDGFRKLGMGYESAKCLAFSAIAATQKGQATDGLKLFAQAREVMVREKNQVWPSLIDLYRALVFFNQGRLFEARRLCNDALRSFPALNLWNKAVLARLLLARIALRTEEVPQALQHVNAAIEKLADLEAPVLTYQSRLLLGDIYLAQQDREKAYAAYQTAREALETLRSSLRGEELKIAFVKNRLEVYEKLVELCMEQAGQELSAEAFQYMEQAKSRSLMDLFVRPASSVLESGAGQSELVRSLREMREELNWYYNLIEREQLQPQDRSQERIARLQQEAQRREKELIHSLQEASEADAAQAGLQTPTHVSLEAVRKALPPDTLLIEYFRIRDRIVVCLLSADRLELIPVTLESRVAGVLRLFQFQLSKFRLDPKYVEAFRAALARATQSHLQELYRELIAPITSQLEARHLLFVPHGLLHYVPFHALFDGQQHLIDRYTVSYAPSAGIFALCQERAANTSGSSLILGIPDAQAPAIEDEVKELAGMVPQSQLYLGGDAKESVLRAQGPACRTIHIATHGHFRQDNPMFSGIRLADSFLSLFDLYHLKLPVELITLSGCSTGLNVVADGDELIGLVRGLLHAGAQSLMLSLWDVHDQSTAKFMKLFYQHWLQGKPKAVALQQAMIALRESYPHPYQWAPFILVGKG